MEDESLSLSQHYPVSHHEAEWDQIRPEISREITLFRLTESSAILIQLLTRRIIEYYLHEQLRSYHALDEETALEELNRYNGLLPHPNRITFALLPCLPDSAVIQSGIHRAKTVLKEKQIRLQLRYTDTSGDEGCSEITPVLLGDLCGAFELPELRSIHTAQILLRSPDLSESLSVPDQYFKTII